MVYTTKDGRVMRCTSQYIEEKDLESLATILLKENSNMSSFVRQCIRNKLRGGSPNELHLPKLETSKIETIPSKTQTQTQTQTQAAISTVPILPTEIQETKQTQTEIQTKQETAQAYKLPPAPPPLIQSLIQSQNNQASVDLDILLEKAFQKAEREGKLDFLRLDFCNEDKSIKNEDDSIKNEDDSITDNVTNE